MAALKLEGETLGQKHRHYNKFLKEATEINKSYELDEIDFGVPDIDNLFKIDIASYQRNVEYILKVFKCEDMLYISRAIKQSKWLITDALYANIINPQYLHDELFPQMTSKAKNKLMLHIRLFLKDEKRVEEFFDYLKGHNLMSALKWLPNCSNIFIEDIMKTHATNITIPLLKRLCEKSISFLEIYCRKNECYNQRNALQSTIFLLHNDIEKYLNILEKYTQCSFDFGPKTTKLVMTKCPKRILENLEIYKNYIDIPTFANHIKKEEIQDFILTNKKNSKLSALFSYANVQYFLKRLPSEIRFDFVQKVFIDKTNKIDETHKSREFDSHLSEEYCCAFPSVTSSNIYQWYKFAPFNVAMTDLKKLIRIESNPSERIAILCVILNCAGRNVQNIETLIQFYWENHINEPFKFKIQFVNYLIGKTDTHKYNTKTWGYINDLFTSMEVYEESNNNVQSCVKSIILYNVIRNENVPKIVEKKFEFDTFKSSQSKINTDEKEKLFNYLNTYLISKYNTCVTSRERGFTQAVLTLENSLRLFIDWGKNLSDYPCIVEKIKELIQIKRNHSWNEELSHLYNMNKSCKRLLFKESILLNPTEEACINVLKHDPRLLEMYKKEVENIYLNDAVILKRLISKIRIYWSQTLAQQLKIMYFDKLKHQTNHKSVISGLCILLPIKDMLELIHKYVPSSDKINWSQSNETELAVQKSIAKRLYLARPQPPLATALLYAKGDYLQYALPSLNALLYNMNSIQARQQIIKLLNAPVSLQKHGIRIVSTKLKSVEMKKIFCDIWNSTKNSSIRADIFKQTFKMLCKEKNPSDAQELWELLSMFIDNLTSEENKSIYVTLSNAHKVPLPIKVMYWTKSYKFLKSLPEKANSANLLGHLKSRMDEIIEFLDTDDAADIFSKCFDEDNTSYEDAENLVAYLLSSRNEDTQNNRFNKVFLPIVENTFSSWNKRTKSDYCTRFEVTLMFKCLSRDFNKIVLGNNMIMPIALFSNILKKLENILPKQENYILLTNLKLTLSYIKIINTIIETEKSSSKGDEFTEKYANNWNLLYSQATPEFAKICMKYLRDDIRELYPSIYQLFSNALDTLFRNFCISDNDRLKTLQIFLQHDDFIEGQLLIFDLLPNFLDKEEKALKFEILTKLSDHPSGEVKVHYWHYLETRYKCL